MSSNSPVSATPLVRLHVCVTCRAGEPDAAEIERPGRRLRASLEGALAAEDAPWLQVEEVACLASCERGCALAISAAGKWSYLLGGLGERDAGDLIAYARTYAHSATGVVMPSKRPASLRQAVLARFPPLAPAAGDPA